MSNIIKLALKEIVLIISTIVTYFIFRLAFYKTTINSLTVNQLNSNYDPSVLVIVKGFWAMLGLITVVIVGRLIFKIIKKVKGDDL